MADEHSDLVASFCAITQADPETAEQYLQVADNSLEQSVALFLDSGGVSLDNQRRAEQSNLTSERAAGDISEDNFEDDDELSRRLQNEEYSNNQDNTRERIRPVTETLVDPEFCMCF